MGLYTTKTIEKGGIGKIQRQFRNGLILIILQFKKKQNLKKQKSTGEMKLACVIIDIMGEVMHQKGKLQRLECIQGVIE